MPGNQGGPGDVRGHNADLHIGRRRQRKTQFERFVAKIAFTDTCWLWQGGRKTKYYGGFVLYQYSNMFAHRWAYLYWVGCIPKGLVIDHLCRVRMCVNPDHLRAVTHRENLLCGVGAPAQNAAKTHCKRGHPFSGENLRLKPHHGRLTRTCRICSRMNAKEHYPQAYQRFKAKRHTLPKPL